MALVNPKKKPKFTRVIEKEHATIIEEDIGRKKVWEKRAKRATEIEKFKKDPFFKSLGNIGFSTEESWALYRSINQNTKVIIEDTSIKKYLQGKTILKKDVLEIVKRANKIKK